MKIIVSILYSYQKGHNMSVLGSQLEIDIDPEGEATILPRHLGNTGTGCFKLHDHRFVETKHRIEGPVPPPGPGLIINKDDEPIGLKTAGDPPRQPELREYTIQKTSKIYYLFNYYTLVMSANMNVYYLYIT